MGEEEGKIWWSRRDPEGLPRGFFQRDSVIASAMWTGLMIQLPPGEPGELPALLTKNLADLLRATFAGGVAWERERRKQEEAPEHGKQEPPP